MEVQEVSTTQPTNGSWRPVNSRLGGYQNGSLAKSDACFLCLGADHQMHNYPFKLKFQQLMAVEKKDTNTVGVNNVEL